MLPKLNASKASKDEPPALSLPDFPDALSDGGGKKPKPSTEVFLEEGLAESPKGSEENADEAPASLLLGSNLLKRSDAFDEVPDAPDLPELANGSLPPPVV